MGKIVAIGGGEIGKSETIKIDKEIIRLTGKKNPKLLFIPTASFDSESYCEIVKSHFGKKLGCKIDILYLIKRKPAKKEIEEKILNSEIIYVGGGDTGKMMKVWKGLGVDKTLKRAYEKGIVLSGLSAGSICWFKWGKVSGLGLINAVHLPHYNVNRVARGQLKKAMLRRQGVAIGIDNRCAIEVIGDRYHIISSKAEANAYKIYWKQGKYYEEKIKKEKGLKPLDGLLRR